MAEIFGKPWMRRKGNEAGELIAKADAARDRRDWQDASSYYRQALEVNPRLTAIWVQWGHALKEHGNWPEAETAYRRSLALDATVADTHLQLGHVLKMQGQVAEAANAYLAALLADEKLVDARRELVALHYSRRDIAMGIENGFFPPSAEPFGRAL